MLKKLEALKIRHEALSQEISSPDIINNQEKYIKLHKEYKELQTLMDYYEAYKNAQNLLEGANFLLKEETDPEMIQMAQEEALSAQEKINSLESEIHLLLIPKRPEDSKNAIIEIRAGTGGDEASIFAGDLYRMYCRFVEIQNWKMTLVDYSEGTAGGYKEIIFNIEGDNIYGKMKFEAGVHREQRVPQTETQGRVHTSAATVVVMPEAEEFDVKIDKNDIRRDFFCSSGPGGQSVNTTYSAVRLTHIPTGIVAQCQDEKSQIKNMEKAMTVLRSRIYELELQKILQQEEDMRRSMVSSGDRSAKIRTYNYPQGRVTDHRINLTLYNLSDIMNGNIQKLIDEMALADYSAIMNKTS